MDFRRPPFGQHSPEMKSIGGSDVVGGGRRIGEVSRSIVPIMFVLVTMATPMTSQTCKTGKRIHSAYQILSLFSTCDGDRTTVSCTGSQNDQPELIKMQGLNNATHGLCIC